MHIDRHICRYAAKLVYEVFELNEAHIEIVGDFHTRQQLNLLDRTLDTPLSICLVDFRHGTIERRLGITRHGHQRHLKRFRIDPRKHHGIGTPRTVSVLLFRDFRRAGARIVTDNQHIKGSFLSLPLHVARFLHELRVRNALIGRLLLATRKQQYRKHAARNCGGAYDLFELHENHPFRAPAN